MKHSVFVAIGSPAIRPKCYLSLRPGLLAAILFFGVNSVLHAQTNTNSDVANSELGPNTPQANRVLLQNSGVGHSIIPDPETILGHRLLHKAGTHNAAAQKTNEIHSNGIGNISSSVPNGGGVTHRFFITDLGTLGGTESFAYAINDLGQVVGLSSTAGDVAEHSFLYSNGRMTDLYPLNSQSILTVGPTRINNSGQIASGLIVGRVYSPVIFDSRTGSVTLPDTLGGVTSFDFNGVATSLNNHADAVGYSYIDAINRHAFLYSNGVTRDIDPLGGYSVAFAINDEGMVVGLASAQFNGTATAFMRSQGLARTIFHAGTESDARGVNNHGQVVGEFLTADGTSFHGFLYSGGVVTDIGSPESPQTTAFAINDQQQVVGTTFVPYQTTCPDGPCVQYKQHAFFYQGGTLADLNSLIPSGSGWELSWAFDINNHGEIVGYGQVNDRFRAFLLTPATSKDLCKDGGWESFGFKNQGQCIQFVLTGK
jgi:probable HAF family extracellular repeat protein